jgi:hypothetical protein
MALPESDARSKKHSRPDGPNSRGPQCKGRRKKSSTFTFRPLRVQAKPIFFPWHSVPVSLPKRSVTTKKNVSRGTDSAPADSNPQRAVHPACPAIIAPLYGIVPAISADGHTQRRVRVTTAHIDHHHIM